MPFDHRRAHFHATALIGAGCALGALLGLLYDRIRNH